MASKSHLPIVAGRARAAFQPIGTCTCRMDFFRQEFQKHHECLERQREYYSEDAIASAEQGLARIMAQLEQLCQREDANDVMGQLLRKLDVVTKLSAWSEPDNLH